MSRRQRRAREKALRHGRARKPARPAAAAAVIVLSGAAAAGADALDPDTVEMVKEINDSGNSGPGQLTNVNGTLFFTANDGTSGYELWSSDGTEAGTTLVKDIWPGGPSGHPYSLTNVGGTLFFQADDGTNGRELWSSDGTEAGTTLVKDIGPGGPSGSLRHLTNVNGTLFFSADDGTNGRELWSSDGTEAGTTLVSDINPAGSGIGYFANFTDVDGTLFFSADDGTSGTELWSSDGTEAGTTLVKDINPAGDGDPAYLTNVDGTLFFSADDGTHGSELWSSDGTEAGTTLVSDINPAGSGIGDFANFTNVDGTLFFSADDGTSGYELWSSDGTEAGTTLVKDIWPGGPSGSPRDLTDVNGTPFFRANDGRRGYELWSSDGTEAGTTLVKDIAPGGPSGSLRYLTDVNGTLFFRAGDFANNLELWRAVDTIAPDTTISSGPAAGETISTTSATFSFEGTGGDTAKLQCSLDGASLEDCTSPHTFTGLGDGNHTARFRALDAVGNTDPTPAERTFTVDASDTIAPDTTISSGPASGEMISSTSATFSFEGTGGDTAKLQCSLDGAPFEGCTSPHTFTGLGEGNHTARFRAVDAAGNADPTPAERTFTVDAAAFKLPKGGRNNTRRGTLKLAIELSGPGELAGEQAIGSGFGAGGAAKAPLIRKQIKTVKSAGTTKLKLKPTAKGKRRLRAALRKAKRRGGEVGKLKVGIAVTFTPEGGAPNGKSRKYTLKLK